ncbi:unnamed protein product [Didymodactylos carnosus]|uniref:Uncharacterized protein n=1 Tax=Didymodactylos carnosus TaxID=1234261 RepID=A0A814CGT4_9BILA|nr:unnamed protein product [Didymodactylos carnosus]CAF1195241.1 unnamed protein product [Didymodactylos carnosus]CAF3716581.1 unnamed protein product [Didymodactylos carnosus]CAF4005420.1 unnamed protein product [Didymodactylos carnosus]
MISRRRSYTLRETSYDGTKSDTDTDENTTMSPSSSIFQSKKKNYKKWTNEEDQKLREGRERFGENEWNQVAKHVGGHRTDSQCQHRWERVLNPSIVKGPWTNEEDNKVRELVEKYGARQWSLIAKHLTGRVGKQCRERWHNHLNPNINKAPWTDKENLLIYVLHKHLGNKWAEIARYLIGRSDNAIKNHWNSSMRKKFQLQEENLIRQGLDWTAMLPNDFKCPVPLQTSCSLKSTSSNHSTSSASSIRAPLGVLTNICQPSYHSIQIHPSLSPKMTSIKHSPTALSLSQHFNQPTQTISHTPYVIQPDSGHIIETNSYTKSLTSVCPNPSNSACAFSSATPNNQLSSRTYDYSPSCSFASKPKQLPRQNSYSSQPNLLSSSQQCSSQTSIQSDELAQLLYCTPPSPPKELPMLSSYTSLDLPQQSQDHSHAHIHQQAPRSVSLPVDRHHSYLFYGEDINNRSQASNKHSTFDDHIMFVNNNMNSDPFLMDFCILNNDEIVIVKEEDKFPLISTHQATSSSTTHDRKSPHIKSNSASPSKNKVLNTPKRLDHPRRTILTPSPKEFDNGNIATFSLSELLQSQPIQLPNSNRNMNPKENSVTARKRRIVHKPLCTSHNNSLSSSGVVVEQKQLTIKRARKRQKTRLQSPTRPIQFDSSKELKNLFGVC